MEKFYIIIFIAAATEEVTEDVGAALYDFVLPRDKAFYIAYDTIVYHPQYRS